MLGTTFSHESIRSYVVAFGTLFNSVQIWRKDSGGTKQQTIDVPLSYAPKEKWLARMNQDPKLEKDVGIILPRMSYELSSMVYAADRKLNTMQRTSVGSKTSASKKSYAWAPVPYDFFFTLFIYARNNRDASMIVEQILPFFTPEFTVTVKEMTDLGVNVDVPIVLNTVNKEETYEGNYDQLRSIVWTLDFTVKGVLYGPVRDANIIKKAYVDFYVPTSTEKLVGTAQSLEGGTTTSIRLSNATPSSVDDFYVGGNITITGGTGSGSESQITAYDGLNKIANLSIALASVPDDTSKYSLTYLNRDAVSDFTTNASMAAANVVSRIYTQPGLTASGLPTDNLSMSVAVSSINANDDYGYIQTHTFYPTDF